jgi:hypothetical protein
MQPEVDGMKQKLALSVALGVLIAAAVLALLVYQASPGPQSQDILGLALGEYDSVTGWAFLSGRRLNCLSEDELPYTSVCRVAIAGEPLTIRAYRNSSSHTNHLGGGCEATYAGRDWPCQIMSRHVHVHWFAQINDPLGLDAAQMEGLRQRYFFENLPQELMMFGTLIAPFVVTLLAVVGILVWRRPSSRYGWMAVTGLSVLTFCSVLFFAFRLTSGFWD